MTPGNNVITRFCCFVINIKYIPLLWWWWWLICSPKTWCSRTWRAPIWSWSTSASRLDSTPISLWRYRRQRPTSPRPRSLNTTKSASTPTCGLSASLHIFCECRWRIIYVNLSVDQINFFFLSGLVAPKAMFIFHWSQVNHHHHHLSQVNMIFSLLSLLSFVCSNYHNKRQRDW